MIEVKFECVPGQIRPKLSSIKKISKKIFDFHKIKEADITFIFGDDELLARLKKEFFQKNHYTDVIAFRLNEYKEKLIEGEIYISIPRAKENAKKFKEPFAKEITRLIIHGCLHLIGFKDKTGLEKKEMIKMENNFLTTFDWATLI